MERAKDPDATLDTYRKLQDITERFDVFQGLAKEPSLLRVSRPSEDILFNRTVVLRPDENRAVIRSSYYQQRQST